MTGAVTYEHVQWFVGISVVVMTFVIGIARAIWSRIEKVQNEAKVRSDQVEDQVGNVRSELMTYKLEVAQKYASIEHLKETEERLVSAINKLEVTIAAMPASIAALIKTGRSSSRSRS